MLECYFDDSADPRRERYYACGGLMGSSTQWDWVVGRWAHETRDLKQPFRATECECGYGQFRDWPKTKRDDLMARLVSIIYDHRLHGFASIVPMQAYKRAFPDCGEHDAFLLAVTQTMMNMAFIADRGHREVGLWFERGPLNAAIETIFNSIIKLDWKPARRLRGIRLEPKDLEALQSADLVAREAFKHSDNLGIRKTRKPICRLWEVLFFVRWNDKALAYLARNGGHTNLKLLSTWDARTDAPKMEIFWKRF